MLPKNEATSCDWLYFQKFNITLFSWVDVLALKSTVSHCDFHCELQTGKMNTDVYYVTTTGYGCLEALVNKQVLRGCLIYILQKMLYTHWKRPPWFPSMALDSSQREVFLRSSIRNWLNSAHKSGSFHSCLQESHNGAQRPQTRCSHYVVLLVSVQLVKNICQYYKIQIHKDSIWLYWIL